MTDPNRTSSSSSTTTWATPTSAATAAKSIRPTSTGSPRDGLRFSQFYNTARCSPSRASLLTGLHPHQTGVGILTYDSGPEGYAGNLNQRCVTIPQALKASGYRTYMSGKWHVASSLTKPTDTWPLQRGFDEFYGTIIGAGSFYDPNTLTRGNDNIEHEAQAPGFFYTDAISDQAVAFIDEHAAQHADNAVLPYVAYTAPHWPLHAHDEDIAKYKGRFDAGWDQLREERLDKLVEWRHPRQGLEAEPPRPDAAAVDGGRAQGLAAALHGGLRGADRPHGPGHRPHPRGARRRRASSTTRSSIFLADNGACAEDIPEDVTDRRARQQADDRASRTRARGEPVHFGNDPSRMPGPENTYQSYGTRLGQPVEHAVPPLQALDPRRRHLDAADRALAERHQRAQGRHAPRAGLPARHHGDDPRRHRHALPAELGTATPVEPLEGHSLLPAFARRRRRAAADVLGARGQRRGAHRQVEAGAQATRAPGSSTTWRPTAPS